MGKMFGQQQQPYEVTTPIDYTQPMQAVIDHVKETNDLLAKLLNKQPAKLDGPETRMEMKTFTTEMISFSSYGYQYFGIFVSGAQTLNVEAMGITYAIPLAAGFNKLPLVDQCKISGAAAFPGLFIWTDHLFI